jgi:hypothetical protein
VAVVAATNLVPPASAAANPRLTAERATALFLANDKVADWLNRYPTAGRATGATYEPEPSKCSSGTQGGCWNVTVTWKKNDKVDAGVIASGKVDDLTTRVTEAWTGPQVAWKMARGYAGAFGGKKINSLRYWLPFCFVFLLGLMDFRRLLSVRNLDLLALLSFSVSLWYFNHGNIFTSVPLMYPPLVYAIARTASHSKWLSSPDPSRASSSRTSFVSCVVSARAVTCSSRAATGSANSQSTRDVSAPRRSKTSRVRPRWSSCPPSCEVATSNSQKARPTSRLTSMAMPIRCSC